MSELRLRAERQMARLAARTVAAMHERAGGARADRQVIGQVAEQTWVANQAGRVCISVSELGEDDGQITVVTRALQSSPVVAQLEAGALVESGENRPLVMQSQRLYSLRHWQAQQTLAEVLTALAARPPEAGVESEQLLAAFNGGGGDDSEPDDSEPDDLQLHAVRLALTRGLLILSGGPGTGKTTTLGAAVRGLHQLHPGLRIALAAPTGKAAARLSAAIGAGQPASLRRRLTAATLHRLLGYNGDDGFMYGPDKPLPFDVVIVDECSMVDAILGAQLLAALRPQARLMLAGDRDQLSSVEPGAFFGAVCAARSDPIADCVCVLQTNYRQREAPQIVAWAQAVRTNTLADSLPETGQHVVLHSESPEHAVASIVAKAIEQFWPDVERAAQTESDADVLALHRAFLGLRVLAVLRSGPFGVERLNQLIADGLRQKIGIGEKSVDPGSAVSGSDLNSSWFAGRLVIVTRNMPALGLFNGDVGLTVRNADGELQVTFESDGELKRFLPLEMPAHDDAFALTVYQSQGSDFGRVLLLPAASEHPLANRAGLYTAITRARNELHIYASPADVRWASATQVLHDDGLSERLAAVADQSR